MSLGYNNPDLPGTLWRQRTLSEGIEGKENVRRSRNRVVNRVCPYGQWTSGKNLGPTNWGGGLKD